MTCVIGARGADGCAIIADTRVTTDFEADVQDKLIVLWNRVALAGSGSSAMLGRFAEDLSRSDIPKAPDVHIAVEIVEDTVDAIGKRYRQRLGRDSELEALITGLEGFDKGEPYLRHVYSTGFSERVENFSIIGHGAPYASVLFRLLYDQMLSAKELAVLGWFTISALAASGLDQTVGTGSLGPMAIMLRTDENPGFLNPFDEDLRAAKDSLSNRRYRLKLLESIWGRVPMAFQREM